MERVRRGFVSNAKQVSPSELGDFSGVRNYQRLLNQRYIEPYSGEVFSCPVCHHQFCDSEILQAHIDQFHAEIIEHTEAKHRKKKQQEG